MEDYELGYRLAGAKGIPLDHDMRVKHHFPGAARDLRNLARRSFLWARLPRPAVFDAVATTPAEGAAALATYGMTAALAAAVLTGVQTFGYLAMALAATHLILRRAFYLLCHNEMGSRFTVAAAFTAMAGDLVVVPSVAAGTLARWTTAGRPRALDGAQG
ncbi:MAG: hypothetical protein M5R36_23675 [Deltaproteobacteria bacterium]|nr:hypothetical protein [Deltaproteobacteria bacterium]